MDSTLGERRRKEMEFLTLAWKRNGIREDKNVEGLPKWVDRNKIEAGQRFARENIFSLFFAHFIALIFLFSYAPIRSVLIRTRRSDTGIKSLRRYLSTLLHVKKWYEGDILSLDGDATQDILRIRYIHAGVSRHMVRSMKAEENDKVEGSTTSVTTTPPPSIHLPELCKVVQEEMKEMNLKCDNLSLDWEQGPYIISQLDMIVTQFVFFGLVATFPRRFGIFTDESNFLEGKKEGSSWRRSGLDSFIHLWALIGHLLGIEDRFNLCLEENSEMRGVILEKMLLPELCKCDATTLTLWSSLTSGISAFIPCISLPAVLRFTIEIIRSEVAAKLHSSSSSFGESWEKGRQLGGEEGSGKLADVCSWKDSRYFELMVIVLCDCIRVTYFRNVLNSLLRFSIYRATRKYLISFKNVY